MKKVLLITAILILAAQFTFGQEKKQSKFNFGITGGVTLYDFKEGHNFWVLNTTISENSLAYIGGFSEMKFSKSFSLRGEINYLLGGNTNFVEVPVILRYRLFDRVFFYAGVQLNYMLKERNSYFNKVGLGFNFGIEYNFAKKWFLDLRYVYKDSQQVKFSGYHAQITNIRLGIGYRF